jgi:ubiquinone/menaquinone biosynthesis C-methylase UbiE
VSAYAGRFADLYDLFHRDKPYAEEAAFVDRILRERVEGPTDTLLDVACGTGRHANAFADLGWTVAGVDVSADMIRNAAARAGDRVRFLVQDMRSLELPGDTFDAAVCLFDSIGYAITNAALLATLQGIARHLRIGGMLVIEFWHAAAMLTSFEPYRLREWSTQDGVVLRTSSTTLEIPSQVATVDYVVHRHDAAGYSRLEERHRNRFFLVQEMALLLEAAGFEDMTWYAGYQEQVAIDRTTWHILAAARVAG